MIQQNFEKYYWVPAEEEKNLEFNINPKYKKRHQIYKDICFSSKPRTEYQLRCNACIAIAVAPELFSPEKAINHLKTTQSILIEPSSLGIKTLDIETTEYVPYYANDVKYFFINLRINLTTLKQLKDFPTIMDLNGCGSLDTS